jgi:hypothetical protein
MRREQLEHAIRTACQIIGRDEVIVVGSQAILGTYTEAQLPPEATMSVEVDVLPIDDDADEVDRLADKLEGAAGEFPDVVCLQETKRRRPVRHAPGEEPEARGYRHSIRATGRPTRTRSRAWRSSRVRTTEGGR